jgi:hypothetical protein
MVTRAGRPRSENPAVGAWPRPPAPLAIRRGDRLPLHPPRSRAAPPPASRLAVPRHPWWVTVVVVGAPLRSRYRRHRTPAGGRKEATGASPGKGRSARCRRCWRSLARPGPTEPPSTVSSRGALPLASEAGGARPPEKAPLVPADAGHRSVARAVGEGRRVDRRRAASGVDAAPVLAVGDLDPVDPEALQTDLRAPLAVPAVVVAPTADDEPSSGTRSAPSSAPRLRSARPRGRQQLHPRRRTAGPPWWAHGAGRPRIRRDLCVAVLDQASTASSRAMWSSPSSSRWTRARRHPPGWSRRDDPRSLCEHRLPAAATTASAAGSPDHAGESPRRRAGRSTWPAPSRAPARRALRRRRSAASADGHGERQ